MKRFNLALVFVLLLGVLVAAFLWLDFQLARSNTQAQSTVSTARSGEPDDQGLLLNQGLLVFVEGPEDLARPLRRELARRLGVIPNLAGISVVDNPPDQVGQPVLGFEIQASNVNWTPVYARAQLNLRMIFASDGELSWRHLQNPVMELRELGTIRVDGDFTIEDTTVGLISRPAYYRYLAEQIALRTGESLAQALQPPPGTGTP